MDSSFQFRATIVEYEKEGQVGKVDLDHGAHKDNENIGEGGSVRKDEENIIADSNKSTLGQKGKWKIIGPPLKQRDTMEIEVELQHQKRKSDNIEGSDGEKKQSNQPHVRGKGFRFSVMWLRDPQCDEVVKEAWQEGLYKTGGSPFVNYMESYLDRLADIQSILSIPLSVRMPRDKLAWAYTSKGNFTVRSVYKITVVEFMATRMEGTSNDVANKTFTLLASLVNKTADPKLKVQFEICLEVYAELLAE
nr:hypothetical protein CFP56_23730 [Quercus suber]